MTLASNVVQLATDGLRTLALLRRDVAMDQASADRASHLRALLLEVERVAQDVLDDEDGAPLGQPTHPVLTNRPDGTLGFVDCGDWTYLAVDTPHGTYYQPHPFRDDWHYTAAAFTDRPEDAHDAWCDRGYVEEMCPACQREAHPDRDEVA